MTRIINLQISKFDFNKDDVAFINRHFQPAYDPIAQKIAKILREWLWARSMNPSTAIAYDAKVSVEDGATLSLYEHATLATAGDEVLKLSISKVHLIGSANFVVGAVLLDHEERSAAEQMLALIDEGITNHHSATSNTHTNILYSLRPLLRDLLPFVATFTANPNGYPVWNFVIDENTNYVTIIELELYPFINTRGN